MVWCKKVQFQKEQCWKIKKYEQLYSEEILPLDATIQNVKKLKFYNQIYKTHFRVLRLFDKLLEAYFW